MKTAALSIVLISLCLTGSSAAAESAPPDTLSPEACRRLTAAKNGLETVDGMLRAGIITAGQAEQARARLLQDAEKAAGRRLSQEELTAIELDPGNMGPVRLTALQRFAGLITFTNILWVIGIILGVTCFCILFWHWLKRLLAIILEVPPQVYEVLLGLAGLGLVIGASWLKPGVKEYIAFTGCLLFGGALTIAYVIHELKDKEAWLFSILAVAAGASTVLHASQLNGFLAVAALMSALGFSVMATPLCYCIGFRDDASLGRATAAGFVMLTAFVFLQIFAVDVPRLMAFRTGALFLGAFVGYLGLLIASSKWYASRTNYVLFQIITVAAGVAALAVGSIWHIPELQRIGGTFFILYLVEKTMEIPAEGLIAWAWKGLAVAGVIFGACMLIKTYPDLLRPYLLF